MASAAEPAVSPPSRKRDGWYALIAVATPGRVPPSPAVHDAARRRLGAAAARPPRSRARAAPGRRCGGARAGRGRRRTSRRGTPDGPHSRRGPRRPARSAARPRRDRDRRRRRSAGTAERGTDGGPGAIPRPIESASPRSNAEPTREQQLLAAHHLAVVQIERRLRAEAVEQVVGAVRLASGVLWSLRGDGRSQCRRSAARCLGRGRARWRVSHPRCRARHGQPALADRWTPGAGAQRQLLCVTSVRWASAAGVYGRSARNERASSTAARRS